MWTKNQLQMNWKWTKVNYKWIEIELKVNYK